MLGGIHRRLWRAVVVVAVALGALALAPHPAEAGSAPSPARTERLELPSGRVDTSTPGGTLSGRRTVPVVDVLLPAGYDDDPTRRFPVLWLLHGANGGAGSWSGGIRTLAAGLPAIVVMPDGGTFGMYADWWNGGRRGGPAWATYHLQEVRAAVEERYRIRPGRRWHAVAGVSMGGQGALRYAAMLPGYFGSVATFSAALPDIQTLDMHVGLGLLAAAGGADGVTYEPIFGPLTGPYAEGNNPLALAPNYGHTRMFLTSGNGVPCPQDPATDTFALDVVTETFLHAQQGRFAMAADAAGARVTAATTCGVHTFGVFDRGFAAARAWGFFEPVPEEARTWRYRTIATSGEAWGLRFRFAEPPTEVVELRRSGDTLAAHGTGRIELRGRPGCRVEADLPFRLELAPVCLGRT